jgi:hypothetical protein
VPVDPPSDRTLQAPGSRDHRIVRVAVRGEQPHLVEAVVADVQTDQHEQSSADSVDVRHNSAHPINDR